MTINEIEESFRIVAHAKSDQGVVLLDPTRNNAEQEMPAIQFLFRTLSDTIEYRLVVTSTG